MAITMNTFHYFHLRVDKNSESSIPRLYSSGDFEPDERGGATVCIIKDDGEFRSAGVALCSPRDNYCKKIGRSIAKGRAEKVMEGCVYLPTAEQYFVAQDAPEPQLMDQIVQLCNFNDYELMAEGLS